jgi:hypothetical protein
LKSKPKERLFLEIISWLFYIGILVGVTLYAIDHNKHPNKYVFLDKEPKENVYIVKIGYGAYESTAFYTESNLPKYGMKEKYLLRTRTPWEKDVLLYWQILYYIIIGYTATYFWYYRNKFIPALKKQLPWLRIK